MLGCIERRTSPLAREKPNPGNCRLGSGQYVSMGGPGGSATDAELVAASHDDPRQFAQIFDRHARSVHRHAAARIKASDVDDIVSDSFIAAFRSRARYDLAFENALPWLLGIATNVLRHHRRAERRRVARTWTSVQAPEPASDPAESVTAAIEKTSETGQVARAWLLLRRSGRHRTSRAPAVRSRTMSSTSIRCFPDCPSNRL